MSAASRPKIMVTRTGLPGRGVEKLASRCEVVQWQGEAPPRAADLHELVRGCDGALVLGNDPVDRALLDAAGDRLKVVALASMGFDSVDQAVARDRGVVVTHTPDVLSESTADIAVSLMLMARRKLGSAVDSMRRGEWRSFQMDGYLGLDVHGATLGLIGYGQIARAVARRAAAFGMSVQHHTRSAVIDSLSRPVGFDELLRTSDIVSLHVPLTPETAGLIGARELAMMKRTATLVNTARGGVVDEQALFAALRAGDLHSAGLDVMAAEPRSNPADELFSVPNLVTLPHIGSATERTRAAMVDLAARNVLAVVGGGAALTPLPGSPAEYRSDSVSPGR